MIWPAIPYYCINLRPNEQRWNDSVKQFIATGIPWVERVIRDEPDEVEGNRWIAFNHSHYETIKRGYETGGAFCIFEDDVMFTPQFRAAFLAWQELPIDWDMLYLGANIVGSDTTVWDMPLKYSQHLAVLRNSWQTHAIIYSQKGAKYVLDNFKPDEFPVLDEWIRVNMMPAGKVFLCNPMIAYQRPVWSDLWKVHAHYGCHEPGNNYLKMLV